MYSTVLAWLRWSCTQHCRARCGVGSLSQWFWPLELRPVIVIIENIGLGVRSECFSVSMLPSSYTTSRTYNWRRLEYNIPFGTSLSNLRTTASHLHLHLHLLLLPHLPQPPLSSSLSLSSSSFLFTLSSLHLSLPHPTNLWSFSRCPTTVSCHPRLIEASRGQLAAGFQFTWNQSKHPIQKWPSRAPRPRSTLW